MSDSEQVERAYQKHVSQEGSRTYNMHPDGCFYCGSSLHHSSECAEREEFYGQLEDDQTWRRQ